MTRDFFEIKRQMEMKRGRCISGRRGKCILPGRTEYHWTPRPKWLMGYPGITRPSQANLKIQETSALLREQSEMAGDAQPFSIFEDPRVGETAAMFVMLAFVGSLFVGCAGNDDGVAVAVQFHVF